MHKVNLIQFAYSHKENILWSIMHTCIPIQDFIEGKKKLPQIENAFLLQEIENSIRRLFSMLLHAHKMS